MFKSAKVTLHSEYGNQKEEDLDYYDPGVQGWPTRCTSHVLICVDCYDFRHGVLFAVALSSALSLVLID